MRRSKIAILGILFTILLFLLFLYIYDSQKSKNSEITPTTRVAQKLKVGVLIPETGNLSFIGTPMKNAILLAQDNMKEKLDNKNLELALFWSDTKGEPKEAITGLHQMIAMSDIGAVISCLSGVTEATYPVAVAKGLFFVGLTVEPSYFQEGQNAIRVFYSFKHEAEMLVDNVSNRSWTRVLVLYSTDAATSYAVEDVLIPALRQRHVNVISDTFNVRQHDFKDLVAKHSSGDFDGIILHGFGIDIQKLNETVMQHPKLQAVPKLASLGAIDIARDKRKIMAGVEFNAPRFSHGYDNKRFRDIEAQFKQRFPNSQFNYSAVYAYDAYLVLAEAFLQANSSDPDDLRAALSTPKQALTEVYRFDSRGDFSPASALYSFDQNGTITRKDPTN